MIFGKNGIEVDFHYILKHFILNLITKKKIILLMINF